MLLVEDHTIVREGLRALLDGRDDVELVGEAQDGQAGIDAARTGASALKTVEVELVQDNSTLHIIVADSGDGVEPGLVDRIFEEGTSTKPQSDLPGGRGIGLTVSRQIARGLGGDIRLARSGTAGEDLSGAEFIAVLPGVMAEQ